MTRTPPHLIAAVALGGAVGGVLRWGCGEVVADGAGFPATTFAINVTGSLLLALVPALPGVRRSRAWTLAVGPGLLGGFTTLSTASEQTRSLLDSGRMSLAATYLVGTLVAGLVAVALASRLSTAAERTLVDVEGGER